MTEISFYLKQNGDGTLQIDREEKGERKPYLTVESFATRSGCLHVTAGTPTWEPTVDEIQELTEMILQAVAHPDLSVLTTRDGVNISYIPFGA